MRFEFATATRIVFGAGLLRELPSIASEFGRHALLVTGRTKQRAAAAIALLESRAVASTVYPVAGEPTLDTVRAGTDLARSVGCDVVVAMGGGSAIDAGKAIAALLTNGGDPLDYLEVIGKRQPLRRVSAPFIAIPTTAGTGSEVTRNAVLASAEHGVKASLRSPSMLPKVALVDPTLLASAPGAVLAHSGLDALSQLIEPYVSLRANPLTDGLAREGIRRSARSLLRAFEQGPAAEECEDLAAASLLGGLCLANAGLGAVHGFAAPIGGMFDAPHGAVCAALLAPVIEANILAMMKRQPTSSVLTRYAEVGRLLTNRLDADAPDAVIWVRELCQALAIPKLASYGIRKSDISTIVEMAKGASSMQANPIQLEEDEMVQILETAM